MELAWAPVGLIVVDAVTEICERICREPEVDSDPVVISPNDEPLEGDEVTEPSIVVDALSDDALAVIEDMMEPVFLEPELVLESLTPVPSKFFGQMLEPDELELPETDTIELVPDSALDEPLVPEDKLPPFFERAVLVPRLSPVPDGPVLGPVEGYDVMIITVERELLAPAPLIIVPKVKFMVEYGMLNLPDVGSLPVPDAETLVPKDPILKGVPEELLVKEEGITCVPGPMPTPDTSASRS